MTTTARITALDALRGFALCGILLVNIPWQIVTVRMEYGTPAATLLELSVAGRFFPLFSFLFGVSFALFLDSAAARTDRPRLVLLRRLLALAVAGLAHAQLHPGEALLPYAVIGIVFLLPASWLPRWLVLAGALLLLPAGVLLDGGTMLLPGLFLLGLAAVRYGALDRLTGVPAPVTVLSGLVAVAATGWQFSAPEDPRIAAFAGLAGAAAYGTWLLLLLRTRPGAAVRRVLAPLGRMALTNYLSATLIAAVAGPLIGLTGSAHYGRMALLAVAILAAQALFSRYWLARHRYGPAEWVWRWVTWLRRPAPTRPALEPVLSPPAR